MDQREEELVHINKYLLKELEYHRKIRVLERRFHETIQEAKSQLKETLNSMDSSSETTETAHTKARSFLFNFWGIQPSEGGVDNNVF